MKIGIFGGSFNPPHKMHKNIAKNILDKQIVDKIIFVPTGSKYQYKHNLLDNNIRYEMLKLMIKDYPNMDISDYEFKDTPVYTYDTLEYFKELYPEDEIYFICGTDNLTYMDTWKNGIYLLENYKFLIIKRRTDELEDILKRFSKYQDNFYIVDMTMDELSSTYIRNNLDDNKVLDYIDKDVYEYIKNNHLYEGE